jgi:hypothetical protein
MDAGQKSTPSMPLQQQDFDPTAGPIGIAKQNQGSCVSRFGCHLG